MTSGLAIASVALMALTLVALVTTVSAPTALAAASSTSPGVTKDPFPSLPLPLGATTPEAVIGNIIRTAIGLAGIVALVMFVYAGAKLMLAGGNVKQVDDAKKTLIWAVIGLIAIFVSYAAVSALIKILT